MPPKKLASRLRTDQSASDDGAYGPETTAVTHARLAAQLLDARTGHGALRTVRRLVGVQAQIPSAAALALRARSANLRAATTAPRLAGSSELVRTWLMRGTIHVVAADDAGWLRELLAPSVLRRNRRRYDQLGLDEATLTRAVDVLAGLVEAGPRARGELFDGLADTGIDPAGQRGIHLVQHAAWHGALVFAPDRDGETAWGIGSSVASTLDREAALCELARRYASGYGPSDARDLAAWSGLPVADARLGWRLAELPESTEAATPPVDTDAADEAAVVRLLPHFDPYLLGYRTREHVVPKAHTREVWTGGGFVLPTVTSDGRAVATWRSDRRGDQVNISVRPFDEAPLTKTTRAAIGGEVADIGRFLDLNVDWVID